MRKLKHYRTIFEFQDDYPDKESREAFVGTLSNEEIDELIDLCNIVQGKAYYQGLKKPEVVFGYTLRDAWRSLFSTVHVMDGPNGAYVEYFIRPEESLYAPIQPSPEGEERIKISREDLKRIRRILDDEQLFETEELEQSVHQMVLDGYQQEFEISSNNRHIIASGSNIQACDNDTENCLHSVLMAKTLARIQKILIPVGVPKKCLKLTI